MMVPFSGLRPVHLKCPRCTKKQVWMLPWGDERIPFCYSCAFHLKAVVA